MVSKIFKHKQIADLAVEKLQQSISHPPIDIVRSLPGFLLLAQSQQDAVIAAVQSAPFVAIIARPQKCKGCKFYYGRSHGGNWLNCAVHPSGYDRPSDCPDREAI